MTDKQLGVLVNEYSNRLWDLLKAAEGRLPDELSEVRGGSGVPEYKLFPCLEALYEFRNELSEAAERLNDK